MWQHHKAAERIGCGHVARNCPAFESAAREGTRGEWSVPPGASLLQLPEHPARPTRYAHLMIRRGEPPSTLFVRRLGGEHLARSDPQQFSKVPLQWPDTRFSAGIHVAGPSSKHTRLQLPPLDESAEGPRK